MRVEMVEDEFDKYFARAALGRGVEDELDAEGRRGSLPSATLKIVEPAGCRRTHSCKLPSSRRRRSVSPRSHSNSPKQRPTSLFIDSNGEGEGNDGSCRNLLSDNYVHEATLRAPSPGTGVKCHSAPHSRSSSWKKSRRPRGGSDHLDPRPRTGSVPLEDAITKLEQLKLLQSDDVCPVRSFTLSSKGLINRGDSFKRKSSQSVASDAGSTGTGGTGGPEPGGEGANRSRAVSVNSQGSSSKASSTGVHIFKVLIVGDHGVGKTALLQQFMTSEYMGATDTSFDDDGEITVSVVLEGEETTMDFVDVGFEENIMKYGDADAYVIVYSITELSSYQRAVEILNDIQGKGNRMPAIIFVANKGDLVRSRQVSDDEVKDMCEARDCKYIEVSAALNHKVDELLVGIVSQVRLNPKRAERRRRAVEDKARESSCVTSAKGLLGKLFRRQQYVSKSCDNLMVL